MPLSIGTTWGSSHPTWGDACQHAYRMLTESLLPDQREQTEITMIEPDRVVTRHRRTVMRWSAYAHLPSGVVLRYDVLDDTPPDREAKSASQPR